MTATHVPELGLDGATADLARTRVLDAARALIPALQEQAGEADRSRRLSDETVAALREAGTLALLTPRRFGGQALDLRTYVEAHELLARGDASAAWVSAVLCGASMLAGLFPEDVQGEVWGRSADVALCAVFTPTATATRVDQGYRIDGKWGFASGCLHADWAAVAFPITGPSDGDGDGAIIDLGLALIPMTQLRIDDTWHVSGMRGTASNTLIAEGVVVPDRHVVSIPRALEGEFPGKAGAEHVWHGALSSCLILGIMGPIVGMAQSAYDMALQAIKKGKSVPYSTYTRSSDSPSVQLALAQAASLIDTARLHVYRAVTDVDTAASARVPLDSATRARIRMDAVVATQAAREAVDTLLNVVGAGSFAEANPLQLIWRNLETASRHGTLHAGLCREIYGRSLAGVPETIATFI